MYFLTQNNFCDCLENQLPMGQCGNLQAEGSAKIDRRRWDDLSKPIQSRALPDCEGQGEMHGVLTPPERSSMPVREIETITFPRPEFRDILPGPSHHSRAGMMVFQSNLRSLLAGHWASWRLRGVETGQDLGDWGKQRGIQTRVAGIAVYPFFCYKDKVTLVPLKGSTEGTHPNTGHSWYAQSTTQNCLAQNSMSIREIIDLQPRFHHCLY